MKNYSSLSQPFNKEDYCARRNMKGSFKRNRLYNFHPSFIHFSFPVSQHLLEVYHSGNAACKEFSSISQQDGFSGKLLGRRHWECVVLTDLWLIYLKGTFKYDSPHTVWVWPALPKYKCSVVFSWTQWSVVVAVCTQLKDKFSPKNLHSYWMSWASFFP